MMMRRRDRGRRSGSSACGATRLAALRFGLNAEARPAAVSGGALSSSPPETAPARIGWVSPYS